MKSGDCRRLTSPKSWWRSAIVLRSWVASSLRVQVFLLRRGMPPKRNSPWLPTVCSSNTDNSSADWRCDHGWADVPDPVSGESEKGSVLTIDTKGAIAPHPPPTRPLRGWKGQAGWPLCRPPARNGGWPRPCRGAGEGEGCGRLGEQLYPKCRQTLSMAYQPVQDDFLRHGALKPPRHDAFPPLTPTP